MIPSLDKAIPLGDNTGYLNPFSNKLIAPKTELEITDQSSISSNGRLLTLFNI